MEEPLRVLQIVTYMGRGGIETMLMNYYRNIDRTKVQFDFLVHRDFEAVYDKEIESLGGRIFRVPKLNPFSKKYFKALKKFFTENKYDIVHSHLDCLSAYPLKVAKKCGVKTRIAHIHSINTKSFSLKYFIKEYAKKRIPKYATDLFACSEEAGKSCFFNHSFTVFNNAIDAEKFIYNEALANEVKEELNLNDFVLCHTGRFQTVKNHTFLIDVFNEVLKKEPNSSLVMIGSGELLEEIRKKAEDLNIADKTLFMGDRPDVNRILQAGDVFVMPSISEGLGMAAIEAQGVGLSCVLSDTVPSKVKVIDDIEFISLKESAEYWADRILEKKGRKKSNCYNKIVEAGFDIKDKAEKLVNFYLDKVKNDE